MAALDNNRHERFALLIAEGKLSQADAYKQLYPKSALSSASANASRLIADDKIRDRVEELRVEIRNEAKDQVVNEISFDARQQFERLERTCQKASEAGDYKTAIQGRLAMLEMFGYRDHPTLTHEHVNGKRIDVHRSQTGLEREPTAPARNVSRFTDIAARYRK
ncbi:hypothetical protein [Oricola indica]|uniref:hypothetical protein n=1 Tax=Oricola indica TaxID=2872591 RepID=UPI003CCBD6B5